MKYKEKIKYLVLMIPLIFIVIAWSCNFFEEDSLNFWNEEVPIDVAGSWRIVKASRNGTDITSLMDFTKFRLNLNEDGMYTIDNYLPFIAKKTNGKWAIDDPVFPFRLFFYDTNSSNEIVANLHYPVTEGRRQIILTFSTGCTSNYYSYVFERTNNK